MEGSWDHVLRAFQKPAECAGSPSELREEPASIEPGKTTSTPQTGTRKKSPARKAKPQGSPKAP